MRNALIIPISSKIPENVCTALPTAIITKNLASANAPPTCSSMETNASPAICRNISIYLTSLAKTVLNIKFMTPLPLNAATVPVPNHFYPKIDVLSVLTTPITTLPPSFAKSVRAVVCTVKTMRLAIAPRILSGTINNASSAITQSILTIRIWNARVVLKTRFMIWSTTIVLTAQRISLNSTDKGVLHAFLRSIGTPLWEIV